MTYSPRFVFPMVLSALEVFVFSECATAQTTDATIQVSKVDNPGTIKIILNLGKDHKGHKVRKSAKISVTAGETPAQVAAAIQSAFPASTVSGNKVTRANPAGPDYGFTVVPTDPVTSKQVIEGVTDTETQFSFLPPPNEPVAVFAFGPNPDTRQTTLASDTVVTAGFANGLSPVSFIATDGTQLSTLANLLNSALDARGYLTTMPDTTDVLVYGQGISLPAEVDFSLVPIDPLGTAGVSIETGLLTAAVPEPNTWVLLTAGSLGLLGYGWRLRHGSHHRFATT